MSSKSKILNAAKFGRGFAMVSHDITNSEAWSKISGLEWKCYTAVQSKYNGSNNGSIVMTARECALRVGCAQGTAQLALTALEDAGFLACTSVGKFGSKPLASTWRLTDFPDQTSYARSTLATMDYKPAVRFQGAHQRRYTRHCPQCGKTFKARRSDKKFCSDACRQRCRRRIGAKK